MVNVDRYGNTSSASIPLALDQAITRRPGEARLAAPAGRVRRRVHLGERRRPVVTVLMCPGQGAQRVGMGKDLAERFPGGPGHLRRHRRRARRRALPHHVGRARRTSSPAPTTPSPPSSPTRPRCSRSSAPGSATVAARRRPQPGRVQRPRRGAARSPPTDAARLVRRRGELMFAAGQERPGAMAAVLGLATAEVEAACDEASRPDGVAVPANLNAPDQTVISGDPAGRRRARATGCKARGAKRVVPLKVSGAFHSPLMAPAVDGLRDALADAPTSTIPRSRSIANASGEAVTHRRRREAPPGRPAHRAGAVGGVHAGARRELGARREVRRGRAGQRAARACSSASCPARTTSRSARPTKSSGSWSE